MTRISLGSEVIHKVVFELRYHHGFEFWDFAGRVTNDILAKNPEFDVQAMDGDAVHLIDRDQNLNFNFGHRKLDLSQQQSQKCPNVMDLNELGKLAETLSDSVVRGLHLDSFDRVGLRVWHLYPYENYEDMIEGSRSLQLLNRLTDVFSEDVREPSVRMIVDRSTHMVRLAVNTFEQTVKIAPGLLKVAQQKAHELKEDQRAAALAAARARHMLDQFPKFGLMADFDAYIELPPIYDAMGVLDFVENVLSDFQKVKDVVLQLED